ncbi:acyl-CoA thioesterase II [Microbacterium sp. zg.Y1090]|uniref:acyl-CoA thioesterase n=1 Tax=Microbacterium wangruii TaxID=3049073 RepID=UPI00214D23DC|nr:MULTISPECIES: acyl-CoA thioesterase II [unclassified Microbacterium]MCR2818878.1 acyl-CoA thioesterase II [Microbacterium sp. zg.Y1090]MDL5486969.1 acyl-CoA thioesterase II [Microbacterium sp. zg-Y1211]WIM29735.1 acyl-CoA thioesterase II [Microbacterium sp. zg-Y1090]
MMLSVLDLAESGARTTEDIFTGVSHPMPSGRVFGGQVLAQAISAAARTLPPERVPHSMHGYFLRPGDATKGITFSVDRIHDGRSFSTRRTQAYQEGVPIFSMIASFENEDPGIEHQAPMPDGVPDPDDLQGPDALAAHVHPLSRRALTDGPIELRYVASPIYDVVEGERTPRQAVWMRSRSPLPDDPAVHRAVLAYLSDLTIQESVLRAHGVPWATPGLKVASLDHAMWWHRFGRVDEWVLYTQESPSARAGRGLATGRIHSRDGRLLATVAQEIMIRVPGHR